MKHLAAHEKISNDNADTALISTTPSSRKRVPLVSTSDFQQLPTVLTSREAANVLRVGVREVRTLVDSGQLPGMRLGPRKVILTTGGAPLRVVQSLLGHSTIRMTERYARLAPGQSAGFMHLLSEASSSPTSGQCSGNRSPRAIRTEKNWPVIGPSSIEIA